MRDNSQRVRKRVFRCRSSRSLPADVVVVVVVVVVIVIVVFVLCRAKYARRERSYVSRIHGRIAVAPSFSLYLVRSPSVSCLYAHVTHIYTHTQSWIMHPCVSTPTVVALTLRWRTTSPHRTTIGCDRESYVRRSSVRCDTISSIADTASSFPFKAR